LIEKKRDRLSTGNLQQAARVADGTRFLLAEERARRPGWSSTSGRARVFTPQGLQDQGRQQGKVGLMRELRRRFHEELDALEGEVQQTGTQAQLLLEKALQALTRRDLAICEAVIRGDDEVDRLYLDVERRILHLFALQTPVASDLRLLTALLHINLHLERIADQAVNLAKITKLAHGLPPNPTVLQHLEEMGALALGIVGAAMAALARRDLELARSLPELDDPLDRLNRGMLGQVLEVSDDQQMLEWGIRMYVVSRQLERIGDNAVDIGEQVAFLVTGEFREFTDASHPEVEHPELTERGGSPE
jgi:phosphate transport system protein